MFPSVPIDNCIWKNWLNNNKWFLACQFRVQLADVLDQGLTSNFHYLFLNNGTKCFIKSHSTFITPLQFDKIISIYSIKSKTKKGSYIPTKNILWKSKSKEDQTFFGRVQLIQADSKSKKSEMVVCYQNCSDLLWKKIVLGQINFW